MTKLFELLINTFDFIRITDNGVLKQTNTTRTTVNYSGSRISIFVYDLVKRKPKLMESIEPHMVSMPKDYHWQSVPKYAIPKEELALEILLLHIKTTEENQIKIRLGLSNTPFIATSENIYTKDNPLPAAKRKVNGINRKDGDIYGVVSLSKAKWLVKLKDPFATDNEWVIVRKV